jgi:hypothetical protein
MKSNLLKTSILLSALLILMLAATATAYAITSDTEITCDLIDNNCAHDCQFPAGAVVAVYQAGGNDCLTEIINAIMNGTQENSATQGNYIILVLVSANGNDDITDDTSTADGSIVSHTAIMPEQPVQTALPMQQTVPLTASQTDSTTSQNNPPQSQNQVEIITRAELSGNPLQGAGFTVYQSDDNQRVGEVTTDENGKASILLPQGEYYMRNDSVQYGYLREQSRIFFTVGASGDVFVEITIERDASIPYIDDGSVTVPKTGELPPVMNYLLGTLLLAVALLCCINLLRQRKRYSYKRKGALAYA